jgi:hypothetical protein
MGVGFSGVGADSRRWTGGKGEEEGWEEGGCKGLSCCCGFGVGDQGGVGGGMLGVSVDEVCSSRQQIMQERANEERNVDRQGTAGVV